MLLPEAAIAIEALEAAGDIPAKESASIRKLVGKASLVEMPTILASAGVQGESIGKAIAKARKMALYPASEPDEEVGTQTVQLVSDGNDWCLGDNGLLYVVNPFDLPLVRKLQVQHQGKFSRVGVISKPRLQKARSIGKAPAQGDDSATKTADEQYLSLVRQAAEAGASDIHFIPTDEAGVIRFRIAGELKPPLRTMDISSFRNLMNRVQGRCGGTPGSYMEPLKGSDIIELSPGRTIKLRVQMFAVALAKSIERQPRCIIRLLGQNADAIDLKDVGLPDWEGNQQYAQIRILSERPHGLMLVSGPTGSGKTSTLMAIQASMLKFDPNRVHYSIEDPVEITTPGISTCEANPKANFDFDDAVEAFMRGDPDVIWVGEIRNLNVAQQALRAAITGHLVMSTIHTNSSIGVITRLVDMGCQRFIIASALMAATAQRLIKRLCSQCSIPVRFGDLVSGEHASLQGEAMETMRMRYMKASQLYADLDFFPGSMDHTLKIRRHSGCPSCGYSGYKGRALVHELLTVSPAISAMIGDGKTEGEVHRQAMKEGFKDLAQHAMWHVYHGNTDLDAASKILDERIPEDKIAAAVDHQSIQPVHTLGLRETIEQIAANPDALASLDPKVLWALRQALDFSAPVKRLASA